MTSALVLTPPGLAELVCSFDMSPDVTFACRVGDQHCIISLPPLLDEQVTSALTSIPPVLAELVVSSVPADMDPGVTYACRVGDPDWLKLIIIFRLAFGPN